MQVISKQLFPAAFTHHVSCLFPVTTHQSRDRNSDRHVSILSVKMMLHIHIQLPAEICASQVTLSDEQTILPLVDEALQHTTTKGIAFQHPEIVAKMDEVRQDLHLEPFYWKLPEQFEGKKVKITRNSQVDSIKQGLGVRSFGRLPKSSLFILFCFQLMAYGGKLKYAIYFEARDETGFSTYKPQVIIRGGTPTHARIITRYMAAPLIGQLTRHEIEMTEVSLVVVW